MSDGDDFSLPLDLPKWNQGIEALFTQPRMPSDRGAPPPRDHHLGSARRVLASTQPPQAETHPPQKRQHDPAAAHAAGLDQLPNARNAEYWLRKAADLEAPKAEAVLMEGLRRDAHPVTSIARALHELHKRVEGSPAASQGFAPPSASGEPSAPRSLTPSRTGLTGRALRVPSRLAGTPGATGAAPPPTKFHGILKKLQFSATGAGTDERFLRAPAAAPVPATATKRLHFCDGTPLATSLPRPTGLKASARRVTFGADTVSPGPSRPRCGSGAPDFSFSFDTPCAIAEGEEEGEEAEDGAPGGTVNSRNAGATPFDRRLSSLFAKYGGEGSAGEEDAAAEDERQQGTPDLWKRRSSVSITDSIRQLTAVDADEEQKAKIGGERAAAEGAPQDDNQLPQGMTPNTAIASVLGELLRRSLADIEAAKAAAASAGDIVPVPPAPSPAPATAGTTAQLSTPAPSLTPMSIDGVARDEHRVPLVTPGTVTMFRGTAQAPRRDDGIAADLLRSFTTPEMEVGGTPAAGAASGARATQGSVPQQRPASDASNSSGGGGGRVSSDFEFRPVHAAPAVPAARPASAAGSESAGDGDTPDLQLRAGCPARSGRLSPDSAAALATPAPAPPPAATPTRGGICLTPAASSIIASLGKAQRVLSPAPPAAATTASASTGSGADVPPAPAAALTPPPSITKYLRGLMEGMALTTPAGGVVVVTPGDADADATLARRSSRLATSAARKTALPGPSAAPPAPAAVSDEGPKEIVEEPAPGGDAAAAGPSASKATPSRTRRTPRGAKTPAPSPAPRYGLRSASKAARPPVAGEEATPEVTPVLGATEAAAGPSTSGPRRRSGPAAAGDRALKLSPTEQKIRSELRRSSRRKSVLEPSN